MDIAGARRRVRGQRLPGVHGDRPGGGADRDPDLFCLSAAHRDRGRCDRSREAQLARRCGGDGGVSGARADDRRPSRRARGRRHHCRARRGVLPRRAAAGDACDLAGHRRAHDHVVLARLIDCAVRHRRARDHELAAARDRTGLDRAGRAGHCDHGRDSRRLRVDDTHRTFSHGVADESRAGARDRWQCTVPRRGDHAAAGSGCRGDDRGAGRVPAVALIRAPAKTSIGDEEMTTTMRRQFYGTTRQRF